MGDHIDDWREVQARRLALARETRAQELFAAAAKPLQWRYPELFRKKIRNAIRERVLYRHTRDWKQDVAHVAQQLVVLVERYLDERLAPARAALRAAREKEVETRRLVEAMPRPMRQLVFGLNELPPPVPVPAGGE